MHHRSHSFFGRHGSRGGGQSHGMGRFGRDFMDGGGGRGFGMGRKLGSTDLQLLILALLSDKPMHGYEIIKALGERSKGFYVPSPGMIYPALTYLEEIGRATVEADGTRKLYHITAAGRDHLTQHRSAADALLLQFDRVGERMERVRRAMDDAASDDLSAGASRQDSREFMRARHDLKLALSEKWNGSAEEQRRLIEILRRATTDILGKDQT